MQARVSVDVAAERVLREKVDLFEAIRGDHELRGWSVRRMVREHRPSAAPPQRRASVRAAPVLGPAKPFIDKVLEADVHAPHKQRHQAPDLGAGERGGIEVAESTVRTYAGRARRRTGSARMRKEPAP